MPERADSKLLIDPLEVDNAYCDGGKRECKPVSRCQREVLLFAAILFACINVSAMASLPGDLNDDGVVDVRDFVLAANIVASGEGSADVNMDGATNIDDLVWLKSLITAGHAATQVRVSPRYGETGVSVYRKIHFYLTSPLAQDHAPLENHVFVDVAGVEVPVRFEVSGNRRRFSVFFLSPVQPGSRVNVRLVGEGLKDVFDQDIDVDASGLPGGELLTHYRTLTVSPVAGTRICGRVFASEPDVTTTGRSINTALEHVRIVVEGAQETLEAFSNAKGEFCLDPSPAGPFFVHIDGRTSTATVPDGAYYPFVGKRWVARPGEINSVDDIFLPLIIDGTLQPVSADSETTIALPPEIVNERPEFAGVAIQVPPDTLFSDDGVRGGSLGIAPVEPDRLPEPLPPGLDFPIVVTVQSDGPTNFAQAVGACFPNLADASGQVLPPGARSALWSFNHESGDWEVAAPARVSADGELVCSEPGTGLVQPGWHAPFPAAVVNFSASANMSTSWWDGVLGQQGFNDCGFQAASSGSRYRVSCSQPQPDALTALYRGLSGAIDFFYGQIREAVKAGFSDPEAESFRITDPERAVGGVRG
jgi:hypothetical protein